MKTYKPGEKAPDSGGLIEIGPRSGKVEGGRRTVIERGERIPPTSEKGNLFKLRTRAVDDTLFETGRTMIELGLVKPALK